MIEEFSSEKLEYSEIVSEDILNWCLERYQKTKQLEFKLSECKDRFKTITECYLVKACELLKEKNQLTIDSGSRIVKYCLILSPETQSDLKLKKRKLEDDENDKENQRKPNEKVLNHEKKTLLSDSSSHLKKGKVTEKQSSFPPMTAIKIVPLSQDYSSLLSKQISSEMTPKIDQPFNGNRSSDFQPTSNVVKSTFKIEVVELSEKQNSMTPIALSHSETEVATKKKPTISQDIVVRISLLLSSSFKRMNEDSISIDRFSEIALENHPELTTEDVALALTFLQDEEKVMLFQNHIYNI